MNEAAATVPKSTRVAPVNEVPVIVTTAPAVALLGVNDEIVGTTENDWALCTLPLAPATDTADWDGAPAGTVAVICVGPTTENDAGTVPKSTCVAPVNPDPVMVTEVPSAPLAGANDEMANVDALVTVNLPLEVTAPLGVVTVSADGDVGALSGTVAVILLDESTVKTEATLPN